MTCELCKNKHATIHITEVIEGTKKELHICNDCAQKQGLTSKIQLSLSDLMGGLTGGSAKKQKKTRKEPNVQCPNCGMDLQTLRNRARLGCSHDLEVFKNWIDPLISKIHTNSEHAGKVPKNAGRVQKQESELLRMKRQLDDAVKREDFETAARLRDEIRQFETKESESP